jgi:histidinol-phosphate phosphatase family protein
MTARFAWERIGPGPRTPREVASMAATSVAIPFAAVAHRVRGEVVSHRVAALPRPAAVLFDRDGTLVVDVPYNGDPDLVRLVPTARAAITALEVAGVPTAVVTNQSGVARGLIDEAQVHLVNRRIDELLGSARPWFVCPHGPRAGCACRKPGTALVERAARTLGVDPSRCVVIGDTGADLEVAAAVGARAILVPTPATRSEEIVDAPEVARSLAEAVELAMEPVR